MISKKISSFSDPVMWMSVLLKKPGMCGPGPYLRYLPWCRMWCWQVTSDHGATGARSSLTLPEYSPEPQRLSQSRLLMRTRNILKFWNDTICDVVRTPGTQSFVTYRNIRQKPGYRVFTMTRFLSQFIQKSIKKSINHTITTIQGADSCWTTQLMYFDHFQINCKW